MILVGQKFQEWTIVQKVSDRRENGQRGANARYWLCRCSCAAQTEREISEHTLSRGTSKSCGCSRIGKPSKPFDDLTDRTFERWTVISESHIDKHGGRHWWCKCSCANQTDKQVSGKSLVSGKSRSCGCLKKELAKERLTGKPTGTIKDLTGQTFGKWTVTALAQDGCHDHKNPGVRWHVTCECGSTGIVGTYNLTHGESQSCGCSPYFNDITDKTYGRLRVIKQAGRSPQGHVRWLCQCVCGNHKTVKGADLVRGSVGSCGCAYQEGIIVRPEHVRKKKSNDTNMQYRGDVKFNLNRRMSAMIRLALRRVGTEKGGRWVDLVNYTVYELKDHLETTMPAGYTWQDYLDGKLHIDHIIPLSAHNYEKPSDMDFQRAWALENLRLLPRSDNMRKNDRLDAPFQPSLLLSAA